jgi:hypothetical protein
MDRLMSDALDDVLRLVAEGRLTAEEAAPVIDALQAADGLDDSAEPATGSTPRAIRIEITEDGRKVVHLRVPMSLGRMAVDHIPGLSNDNITRIREALDLGLTGPILVVDEGGDGNGVRIVLE